MCYKKGNKNQSESNIRVKLDFSMTNPHLWVSSNKTLTIIIIFLFIIFLLLHTSLAQEIPYYCDVVKYMSKILK
jgi:hypothetical protein